MRAWSLVFLALWFFTLRLKPVNAAGSGTLEVIMPKRVAMSVVHSDHTCSKPEGQLGDEAYDSDGPRPPRLGNRP